MGHITGRDECIEEVWGLFVTILPVEKGSQRRKWIWNALCLPTGTYEDVGSDHSLSAWKGNLKDSTRI